MVKGVLNLYGCGGTGVNIVKRLTSFHETKNEGFAEIKAFFVDTSKSNIPPEVPEEQVFIYKDNKGNLLDGNGKLRKNNYEFLSESSNIGLILDRFKPGTINVVIHSGGGGTGSVVGPLLVKELLSRDENVIVLMVGSTVSRIDVQNTLNTLKTYDAISKNADKPVNVLYRENSREHSRLMVDKEIERYINMLTVFYSSQNEGLDTSDLRNFLEYTKVTNYSPKLTALDMFANEIVVPIDSIPITAVSLTLESVETDLNILVDFHVSGIISVNVINSVKDSLMPLHMVTFSGFFPHVVTRLENILKEHESRSKLISSKGIVSGSDKANDHGMIL